MEIKFIHDIVNKESGKTFKDENLEKGHKIPLSSLVEVVADPEDESEYDGIRLYVVGHIRDCDGTPLYALGLKGAPLWDEVSSNFYHNRVFSGFSEESLKLIK